MMEEIERDGEKRMVLTPKEGDDFLQFLENRINLYRRHIKVRVAMILTMVLLMTFIVAELVTGETSVIGPLAVLLFWMILFIVRVITLWRDINKDSRLRDVLLIKLGCFEIDRAFQEDDE